MVRLCLRNISNRFRGELVDVISQRFFYISHLLDHKVVTCVLEEMGFKAGSDRGVGCSMSVSCRDQHG